MTHWKWLGLGSAVVALIVAALSATPLIRRGAIFEAEKRGVSLEVGDVTPGWFEVTLHDVRASFEGVEGVEARLDTVKVDLTWSLGVESVTARGGEIEIEGPVDRVREQLEAWRTRRGGGDDSSGGGGSSRRYRAEGMSLVWRGAFASGDEQQVSGLHFERTSEAQRVALDLLRVDHPRGRIELAGAHAAWNREGGVDRLVEARVSEARVKASWSPSEEEKASDAEGLEVTPADQKERDAEKRALADRLPPLEPGRGQELAVRLAALADRLSARLPEHSSVESLWLEVTRGKEVLHFGPSRFEAKRSNAGLDLSLIPGGETKGTSLALTAHLPRGKGEAHVRVEGGPVSLATLGVKEGDFGLMDVGRTRLGGLFDARLAPGGEKLVFQADAELSNLAGRDERLAPRPISLGRSKLRAQGAVDLSGARYELSHGELQVGETSLALSGTLERGEDYVTAALEGGAPLVSCQALLDSAPRGLLGSLEAAQLSGTFSLKAGVTFDTRKLSDMRVEFDFKNECRVKDVAAAYWPSRFSTPFEHEVMGPGGYPMTLETGPGTQNWTPISAISPHLETAVLVCEDGRFERHSGFDPRAIESAIRDNVRAGRFLRGASTISMQLAKNLYLSREKNLSRKLQEALLTVLLEQELEKRELLELYFNVVELGPGIYGVRQAAEFYFSTTPDRLTLAQAFFLASILPAPTREYFEADGSMKEGRRRYVNHLLEIAERRKRITPSELEAALTEDLRRGGAHEASTVGEGSAPPEQNDVPPYAPRGASHGAGPGAPPGGSSQQRSEPAPPTLWRSLPEPAPVPADP